MRRTLLLKKQILLNLALAFAILSFSSCSKTNTATHWSKLDYQQAIAKQSLPQPTHSKVAATTTEIPAPAVSSAASSPVASAPVAAVHTKHQKHAKTTAFKQIITEKAIAHQMKKMDKVIASIAPVVHTSTLSANIDHNLKMAIILVLIGLLFEIIGGVTGTIGIIFYIIGLILVVVGIIFLIIWLMNMA